MPSSTQKEEILISHIIDEPAMPFYDPPLDLKKETVKHSLIKSFDKEAREDGSMFEIRDKYLETVPGADAFICIVGPWRWHKDLIESHGGEYAVYEECIRRNVTWEELVNVKQHTEKIMKGFRKQGGFTEINL